jgi:outer membrane protein assembly factor BamB
MSRFHSTLRRRSCFSLSPSLAAATVCGMLLVGTATAAQPSWPQFLGPERNGISAETGLVDAFPASGPKQVWRTAGGVGMSGLVVDRGRLLTTVQRDGKETVLSLDAATGKTIWQTPFAAAFDNSMGPGTRATPTIAGDRVFVFSGDGVLTALNFADGATAWSQNVLQDAGGRQADYGMACSPLVVGDRVIVVLGAAGASVAAYDAATGKKAWTSGDDVVGYSSPALLDVGGRKQIVAYTGSAVLGLAPENGAMLWRYPYETDFGCNTATPVAVGGNVYISSGENHGGVMLRLTPQGEKFDVAEVWSSQGTQSVLRAEWQTPLVLDGRLYGFDNVGAAGPVTHLTCIDGATGERLWQKLRFGKGNAILADGKLWCSMMTGELVVVRAVPTGYEELARADVGISTRQAPALADGRLYLRDDANIACYDVRK